MIVLQTVTASSLWLLSMTVLRTGFTALAVFLLQEGSQYRKDVAEKNFQKPVLGYVTPW